MKEFIEMLKKIKLVAAVDLIRYYAITTVEDEYLGKCANTYDNKCILLTALRDYLSALEAQGVIRAGSSGAELDADATRSCARRTPAAMCSFSCTARCWMPWKISTSFCRRSKEGTQCLIS